MPNNDGTGPQGKGPKTGRGMGKCNGQANRCGQGQGRSQRRGFLGRVFGRGRGQNN